MPNPFARIWQRVRCRSWQLDHCAHRLPKNTYVTKKPRCRERPPIEKLVAVSRCCRCGGLVQGVLDERTYLQWDLCGDIAPDSLLICANRRGHHGLHRARAGRETRVWIDGIEVEEDEELLTVLEDAL